MNAVWSSWQAAPLLSLMLAALLVAAMMVWLLPRESAAKHCALAAALFNVALSLLLIAGFNSNIEGFQYVETMPWIPSLQVQYKVGVDGMSMLFLALTSFLFVAVILASWNSIRKMSRLYFSLLLILECATLGIFCALDLVLFFLFWELTLIPLFFLVSLWGIGPHRRYAATKYTLYMLVGGIPLLFGFLVLAFNAASSSGFSLPYGLQFDYVELLHMSLPPELETMVFLLLVLGFAVKTPLVPLHTWLPLMAQEGPLAVMAYITGLKVGVYGLVRFAIPLAPNAAVELHWLLAGLGAFAALYGALIALAQTNLLRMLAYLSISHVGVVVLGIASYNLHGIQGALFQLMNFVVISSTLYLLAGFLHRRVGSSELVNLGGAAMTMPRLATLFFLFGLAMTGVPGSSGFPAEFLLMLSILEVHRGAGLAALVGLVIGVACFFSAFRRAFLGPMRFDVLRDAVDLRRRELLLTVPALLLVIAIGLFPQWVIDFMHSATDAWVAGIPTLQ